MCDDIVEKNNTIWRLENIWTQQFHAIFSLAIIQQVKKILVALWVIANKLQVFARATVNECHVLIRQIFNV